MQIGREVSGKPSNGSRASRIYYQEQANTYSESSNLETSFKYELLQSKQPHTFGRNDKTTALRCPTIDRFDNVNHL